MERDDAALTAAAREGDRGAFADIYRRYADRLHDFCYGLLRDRDEAADAVHDTFLLAAERLDQLREPGKLRAWLFAIARREVTRRGMAGARARPAEEVPEVPSHEPSTEERVAREDLARLVWAAAAGLDHRDRVVMELAVRQGLETHEIADAVGVSPAHASVLVSRMHARVERALGALLVARLGRRDCPELQRVLAGWDGTFSVQMRKRVARHADSCERCDGKRRGALSPVALLGVVPVFAAPAWLRERVLGDVDLVAARLGATREARRRRPRRAGGEAIRWRRDGFPPPMAGTRRRPPRALLAAAAVLLAVLGGGLALLPERPGVPRPARAPSPATPGGAAPDRTVTPAPPPASPAGSPPIPSTPPASSPQPASPPAAAPARLALSVTSIDLGATGTRGTTTVSNEGGRPLSWSVTLSTGALSAGPSAGTLGPGESATVSIALRRTGLAEGDHTGSADVASDGGEGRVTVAWSVERRPVISKVSSRYSVIFASKPSGCSPQATSVAASVTDESDLSSVVLRWIDPDGARGSRPMKRTSASTYAATLGPFASAGTIRYWVEATDPRGNGAKSAAATVEVKPCSA